MQSRDGLALTGGRNACPRADRETRLDGAGRVPEQPPRLLAPATRWHPALCGRCAVRPPYLTTALQHSDRSDVARIFGGLVAVGRRGLRVQAGDRSAAEPAQAFLDGELGSVRVPRPRPLAPSIDDDSKAAIIALYRAGTSQQELARRCGPAQSLIFKVFVAAGASRERPQFVARR